MTVTQDADPTREHVGITDTFAARRYFAKFRRITGHLVRVAAEMERDRLLRRDEVAILTGYVARLANTFEALGTKYLMTGRDGGTYLGSLAIDRVESGFPIHRELLQMAADASQLDRHLSGTPGRARLIEEMIARIVGDLEIPTRLQFTMSQRLYYEALAKGNLFWPQNDPVALWQGEGDGRRRYLLHWAIYDSQVNLPTVYLLELEDSGRVALPKDAARWASVQAHLAAQSLGGLKLVTIASGFDTDFDDLHPKRLRRLHLGPMYSSAFTRQHGPIRDVLEAARAPAGDDWALAWTVEDLQADRVREERKGWFGTVERQIFALDPFEGRGAETGATATRRAVILPQRPYQALAELQPAGFRDVTKYVVSAAGSVMKAQ
ncbi:hypothetical protein ILP92_06170 [Maribius pontilimi]|uniref:Uncharacterized protein n=1 Tax=Palleronia pontilimi TaxID=1964209 RepID=A0A934IF58_9RHOB|nr:hypothetical protein [Palleronia pontilimi]MBJ3762325.1 hypothetical protein [Palleronia pontilimi]